MKAIDGKDEALLEEARQLKSKQQAYFAAGRKPGITRRHVVVSFTLDELAEAIGVSKRTLQHWRKTERVNLEDRAVVVALLRSGAAVVELLRSGTVKRDRRTGGRR